MYLTAYEKEPPFLLVPWETLPTLKDNWLLGFLYFVPSPQVTHVSSSGWTHFLSKLITRPKTTQTYRNILRSSYSK